MAHNHWRSAQDWADIGLRLSTGSDEVCKLYDAAVTQVVLWTDNESLGGLAGTFKKMLTADPDFLLGHVLDNGLELMSYNSNLNDNKKLKEGMAKISDLLDSNKHSLTDRERKHGQAFQSLYKGNLEEAAAKWEEVLVQHPTDFMALKLAQFLYFYLGRAYEMRDSVARVLPVWKPSMPLYGSMHSMHAFGLHESFQLAEAEAAANKALSFNEKDVWAIHGLAHVMEMAGRQREGVDFMERNLDNWQGGNMLACHNFWHWSLYYVELGDFEAALSIFDEEFLGRARKSDSVSDFSNMVSVLLRLEMEGVNVGDRWDDCYHLCKSHINEHGNAFYDYHLLIACLRADQPLAVKETMESLEEMMSKGTGYARDIYREVGADVMKSLVAYSDGDFSSCVDLLYPLRYQRHKMGGSYAQRDLINLVLIHACIKSPLKVHNNLAKALLNERKVLKANSPLTDRLMAKVLDCHGD